MATKGSRATANYSAKADISVGKGQKIEEEFLLVPIGSYDVILGMPFMVKTRVILDPAEGTATFRDHGHSLQCLSNTVSVQPPGIMASASMEYPPTDHEVHESSTNNAPILEDEGYWTDVCTYKNDDTTPPKPCSLAVQHQIRTRIPDFEAEFPQVFPRDTPMKLPPLRPGLNHRINLDESKKNT